MLPDVTKHTRATSFAHSIVRPLVKSLPLVCAGLKMAALNICTGPAHFSDRWASTLYLSLALQDHRVKCRASRLKITVARSMTNFATFSCILCLKNVPLCMYCLTSVHTFLRKLFLTTLSSLCVISHEYRRRSGKMGASRFSWGPVTFQIYWPPGPVAPGA